MEYVLLEVGIDGEVYCREGNITHQTSAGTLVQSKDSELTNDVGSAFGNDIFRQLCRLALHLESDFPKVRSDRDPSQPDFALHNFQGIRKNLDGWSLGEKSSLKRRVLTT